MRIFDVGQYLADRQADCTGAIFSFPDKMVRRFATTATPPYVILGLDPGMHAQTPAD